MVRYDHNITVDISIGINRDRVFSSLKFLWSLINLAMIHGCPRYYRHIVIVVFVSILIAN